MRPRADEVLRSAIWTYDTYIAPEVSEPFAKSLSYTVGNLMRNALARIEHEGQALFDEAAETREVLLAVRAYATEHPSAETTPLSALPARIDEVLGHRYWDEAEYPSLAKVTERATDLRAVLAEAIEALQAIKPEHGTDPGYEALRAEIRGVLKHQLEREAVWSTLALEGPRR